MRLIQGLCIVLTELSVGSLLLAGLLPTREIRASFFTFISLLGAVLAGLALVLTKCLLGTAWWDVRYLGLTVVGATAAWGCFRLDRDVLGRVLLIVSGLVGLVAGLLPLSGNMLAWRGINTSATHFFEAGVLSATLLLGATTVGMILGHWYLIMRRLSFIYLLRFAQLLLGAVALRGLVVGALLTRLPQSDLAVASALLPPLWSPGGNLFFFLLRLLFGLALPAVLGLAVLRCVQAKANQAATGLLYVCEISVLFGELFAVYLLV